MKRFARTLLICLLGAFFAAEFSALFGASYKVEVVGGVPFITVDGVPVRSRHFLGWGGRGMRPQIDSVWRDFTLDFSPPADSNSAAIKILVGNNVSDLYISKTDVENLSDASVRSVYDFSAVPYDKSKLSWLFPAQVEPKPIISAENVVVDGEMVLRINKIQKDQSRDRLVFHIRSFPVKKGERYRIKIRAKTDVQSRLLLVAYTLDPYRTLADNAYSVFGDQVKIAHNAGVDFVHFGVSALGGANDAQAKREIDAYFSEVLAANPAARIIVRIGTEYERHRRENPDEVLTASDGRPITRPYDGASYSSPSSEKFRAMGVRGIEKTIEYLESKYGANMAGYHPTGGQSGEFFYGASGEIPLAGYDGATVAAWRKWLRKKYLTPENLQTAWRAEKCVPFEEVGVPTPAERREKTGSLLDPAASANVIDFNAFLQDEMSDHVLAFANAVRRTARRLGVDRLSLVFFGYAYELTGFFNGPAVSGHYALKKILDSSDVDIVSGPISYSLRGLGGQKLTMSAAESVSNAGKMWFDEDDNRTYLIWTSGSPLLIADKAQKTAADTRKVMRRNLSQQTLRNHGAWWMDLFSCGWYNDPEIWEEMKLFRAPELEFIEHPRPYSPDVALIHSDRSAMYIGGNGISEYTAMKLLHGGRIYLGRLGVLHGQYLLDDVLDGRVSAKLKVYLLAPALTSVEREKLAAEAKRSASIWCWTSGLVDLDKNAFSTAAVKELTGFETAIESGIDAKLVSTEAGRVIGLPQTFGLPRKIVPLLSAKAGAADLVLAKYSNGANAIVLRNSGGHPQLFVGIPFVPPELYRFMAKISGAHVYTDGNAAVFANGGYVSITANETAKFDVDFGFEANVFDALTGEKIGSGRVLKFDMKRGDTLFLRTERVK